MIIVSCSLCAMENPIELVLEEKTNKQDLETTCERRKHALRNHNRATFD